MSNEIIVALLALAGTLLGTFSGILASARLTTYRIEQLEKKVDRHNNFASRIPLIEEKLTLSEKRISAIEREGL